MSEMDPKDFLSRLEEVLPPGKRPQGKAEWVIICEALELPTDVGVAEMIESVYTEKGLMLSAYREGVGRERQQKTDGAGGVAVLKDMLAAITESNVNTQAMLERSLNIEGKRHEIEVENLKQKIQQSEKVYKLQYKPGILKMPNFNESDDDLENYIKRFEALASSLKLNSVQKVHELVSHLKGKALDTYTNLPPDCQDDYEPLRTALLLRFGYTRDEYKSQFRNIKTKSSENIRELATRCERYLSRWLYDSDRVPEDCIPINETLIIDQIYQCLPVDLVVWLKDRSPATVTQIIDLVEVHKHSRGLTNHTVLHVAKSGTRDTHSAKSSTASSVIEKKVAVVPVNNPVLQQSKGRGQKGKGRDRFPSKGIPKKSPFVRTPDQMKVMKCFNCSKMGHTATDCTETKDAEKIQANLQLYRSSGSEKKHVSMCISPDRLAGRFEDWIYSGQIEGNDAQMYADTAANITLVSERLVPKDKYTGGYETVCTLGGSVLRPLATVEIRGNRGKKIETVAVVDSFPKEGIDVLLGLNSFDVINPFAPKTLGTVLSVNAENVKDIGVVSECINENECLDDSNPCGTFHTDVMSEYVTPDEDSNDALALFTTRSHAAREMARLAEVDREMTDLTPQITPIGGDHIVPVARSSIMVDGLKQPASMLGKMTMFDITTVDLIREQIADKTLAPIWAMAKSCKHNEVSNYFVEDGMLCKGSSPKDEENGEGRSLFQIVIPKCYRNCMLELAHNIFLRV